MLEYDTLSSPWIRVEEIHTPESWATAAALELELTEYFEGKRKQFDLPLNPRGTPFQKRIWRAIAGIPFGGISTYAGLAEAAGTPRAYQAAGTATGRNPLAILVPCHRILPADLYHRALKHPGSLTDVGNYAGGKQRKEALLRLEGIYQ